MRWEKDEQKTVHGDGGQRESGKTQTDALRKQERKYSIELMIIVGIFRFDWRINPTDRNERGKGAEEQAENPVLAEGSNGRNGGRDAADKHVRAAERENELQNGGGGG